MPRRSLRTSSAAATPQKVTPMGSAAKPRATPKKSQHFPNRPNGSAKKKPDPNPPSESELSSPSVTDAETSGYEDEDSNASEPTSADEEEDDYSESDDTARPRKRQKQTPKGRQAARPSSASKTTSTPGSGAKGQELWRPGVKTGLGPGKQVIIDKPKARLTGKTPYTDSTIHPNTMLFLSELAENNDREWLKMHDPDYRTSWRDFTSFLEELQKRLVTIDETVPELPTKDIIFRIYRDIRFSPDPTPYKTHFSAAWSRTGRKGPYAAYYVQIKPGGGSFVGGGLWHPEAEPVALLRRDIDRHPHRLKAALKSPGIRKEFLGGAPPNDDKKAIKAFAAANADNALKTKPRDYAADHRDIALLRLKNFTVGRRLKDEEVLGPRGIERVAELFACLLPFITYLNSTVMPDGEPSDSDDDDDENDDNDGDEEEEQEEEGEEEGEDEEDED